MCGFKQHEKHAFECFSRTRSHWNPDANSSQRRNFDGERPLHVEAVAPVRLESVEYVVQDQDGEDERPCRLTERDSVWSN